MKHTSTIQRALALVIGRQLFTTFWLSASQSISIVQMRLLAQSWLVLPHALAPACLMSAWILGSLIGSRLPRATRIWGSSSLACILLWLIGPALVSWHLSPAMVSPALVSMIAQQRSWPAVGERLALARSLVGFTVGLVVAWMLPAVAGLIALTCCLPLLALDSFLSGCAPLSRSGSVAASWIGRYWTADHWQLQLDQRAGRWRWWSFLRERSQDSQGYLPLSFLASGIAVIPGGVWGAVPTPFAASLGATHTLDKLAWLLGGQLVILVLATGWLCAARNVIGFPGRLVPVSVRSRVRTLALLMPMAMAGGLAALGLPFLQAPWWLAVSLAGYTLAGAVWGILLPRLRPAFAVAIAAQRHLSLTQNARPLDSLHLTHGRARGVCQPPVRNDRRRAHGPLHAAYRVADRRDAGLTSYYKYERLYDTYQGDEAHIAAAFRRSTFRLPQMKPAQFHFSDTCQLLYYGHTRVTKTRVYQLAEAILGRTKGHWVDPDRCGASVPENLVTELLDLKIPMQAIFDNPEKKPLLTQIEMPSTGWFSGYTRYIEAQPDLAPNLWKRESLEYTFQKEGKDHTKGSKDLYTRV